jgi:hypothetical protein
MIAVCTVYLTVQTRQWIYDQSLDALRNANQEHGSNISIFEFSLKPIAISWAVISSSSTDGEEPSRGVSRVPNFEGLGWTLIVAG